MVEANRLFGNYSQLQFDISNAVLETMRLLKARKYIRLRPSCTVTSSRPQRLRFIEREESTNPVPGRILGKFDENRYETG